MTPKERAFRKQLLLVKGDALRMQVRIEMGMVRKRFDFVSMLTNTLRTGSQLSAFFSSRSSGQSGWRAWIRMAAKLTGIVQTLRKLFTRA
jgi:hypothetical protein